MFFLFGFLDTYFQKSHIIELLVSETAPLGLLLFQIFSSISLPLLPPSSFFCQRAESHSDSFYSCTHTLTPICHQVLSLTTSKSYLLSFYFITIAITLGQISVWPGLMHPVWPTRFTNKSQGQLLICRCNYIILILKTLQWLSIDLRKKLFSSAHPERWGLSSFLGLP